MGQSIWLGMEGATVQVTMLNIVHTPRWQMKERWQQSKLCTLAEVTLSNAMEKEEFERCIQDLAREEVTIKRIAKDHHTSISSSMKKDHGDIDHQYDVWHLSKWVIKQHTKKAKVKGCEDLSWIRSVSNHMWWCSATCDGNAEVLKEKWKSVLFPVANRQTRTSGMAIPTFMSVAIHDWPLLRSGKRSGWGLITLPILPSRWCSLKRSWKILRGSLNFATLESLRYITLNIWSTAQSVNIFHTKAWWHIHNSHHSITMQTVEESRQLYNLVQVLVKRCTRSASQRYRNSGWLSQWKKKKSYAHVMVLMDTVANACETGEVEIEPEARHLQQKHLRDCTSKQTRTCP